MQEGNLPRVGAAVRQHQVRSSAVLVLQRRREKVLHGPARRHLQMLDEVQKLAADVEEVRKSIKPPVVSDRSGLSDIEGTGEGVQGGHQNQSLPQRRVRRQRHPAGADPSVPRSGSQEQHEDPARLLVGDSRPSEDVDGRLQAVAGDHHRLRRRAESILPKHGRVADDPLPDGAREAKAEEGTADLRAVPAGRREADQSQRRVRGLAGRSGAARRLQARRRHRVRKRRRRKLAGHVVPDGEARHQLHDPTVRDGAAADPILHRPRLQAGSDSLLAVQGRRDPILPCEENLGGHRHGADGSGAGTARPSLLAPLRLSSRQDDATEPELLPGSEACDATASRVGGLDSGGRGRLPGGFGGFLFRQDAEGRGDGLPAEPPGGAGQGMQESGHDVHGGRVGARRAEPADSDGLQRSAGEELRRDLLRQGGRRCDGMFDSVEERRAEGESEVPGGGGTFPADLVEELRLHE